MEFQFGVTRAPGRILFGAGQRRVLGRAAASLGKRALVCTDAHVAALPMVEEMLAGLRAHGIVSAVFDRTQPELPLESIEECIGTFRQFNPDLVIGVGGGSCLDMAKLVSLLLTHGHPIQDYYGEFKVPGPLLPIIAVPTTSGTGSEVTPVAVLADSGREMKVGVSSPELIPQIAICDPELTMTCPPLLTAISGADALGHAIESFTAIRREPVSDIAFERVFVGKNVLSDSFALTAIRLIFEHLPKAVEDGENGEARSAMMLGATLAGLAFGSGGCSAAHAIQYPIGAVSHTAHGLGIAILLPHAMEFNIPSRIAEFAEIARLVGAAREDATPGEQAHAAVDAVRRLFGRIGIPATLAEIGVAADQWDWIAERSLLAARLVENNPRPLDRDAVLGILKNATTGSPARPQAPADLQKVP